MEAEKPGLNILVAAEPLVAAADGSYIPKYGGKE